MLSKIAIKLSLFLATLFLGDVNRRTAVDYRIWLNYLDVLDTIEDKDDIRPATRWILDKTNYKVKVACFTVYLAVMEPIVFVLSILLVIGGTVYSMAYLMNIIIVAIQEGL